MCKGYSAADGHNDGEGSRSNQHKRNRNGGRPYVTKGITVGHQAQMTEEVKIKILGRKKVALVPVPRSI